MNIIINTQANPKELGEDAYNLFLETLTQRMLSLIPNAIVYRNQDASNFHNRTVIVPDTFSFGTGGGMRIITRRLLKVLFYSNARNTTLILLEPNTKHAWAIDEATSISFHNIGTFIQFYPKILTI